MRQENLCQFCGCETVGHLAKKIVGLRWHHVQEWDLLQIAVETISLINKLIAGFEVVLFVFSVYLHIEFSKRIDIPNCNIFFIDSIVAISDVAKTPSRSPGTP